MKKMSMVEEQRTERKTTQEHIEMGQPWRGRSRKKRQTKEEDNRRAVCLHWIISVGLRLRVPAVDSGLCKNS